MEDRLDKAARDDKEFLSQ